MHPGDQVHPADYTEPVVLGCLGLDGELRDITDAWRQSPGRNVALVVPASLGRQGVGELAAALRHAARGKPAALFCYGPAALSLPALIPPIEAEVHLLHLIIVGALPPTAAPASLPASALPMSVVCGRRDLEAPPAAMAGWRHHSGRPFRMRVFEDDAGFLRRQPLDVLDGIQQDLGVQRSQIPGHGFSGADDGS